MNNKVLLAIPARGGSKRLPRKNLKLLHDKPMLAYSIEAAIQSNLSDYVYVCTEDDEIATVAEKYGANVFKIPQELAEDDVSSTSPCLKLYKTLRDKGAEIDYIFNLQPSSPLRSVEDIRCAYDKLISGDADFLVSVTLIDPHYFHWAMINREKDWEMYFGKEYLKERIFLPSVYRPNGAIKLAKAEKLLAQGNYFGKHLTVYPMPEERSIHVATAFDFECAHGILRNKTTGE